MSTRVDNTAGMLGRSRTPVDCILLDAGPPGLEGLEVCRRLRGAGYLLRDR